MKYEVRELVKSIINRRLITKINWHTYETELADIATQIEDLADKVESEFGDKYSEL